MFKYLVLLCGLLLGNGVLAQTPQMAPTPKASGKASGLARMAHELKSVFTDCKTDKVWCAYVVGTIAINFTDVGTTCKFRTLGEAEANPLLPKYGSCAAYLGPAIPVTLVQLTAMHYLRRQFVNKCRADAADPNSKWNHIDAGTHDPESCKYGMDVLGMMEWPLHIVIIHNNIQDINNAEAQRANLKPDLSHVVLLKH